MRSVMHHSFSMIPKADISRSNFSRTSGYKCTFSTAGGSKLIPFFVDEVLPGDTFNMNVSLFGRLATPIVPFADNLFLETFWFFCPNRLVWDNWQRFMGEQDNPGDSTDFLVPTISAPEGGFEIGSTADYLGIPTGVPNIEVNALPFRCINAIWKEWFRDENLQNSPAINKGDGPDDISDYPLLPRCKARDYFTACLPWPMKGPGVTLPLVGDAKVYGDGTGLMLTSSLGSKLNSGRLYEAGNGDLLAGNFHSSLIGNDTLEVGDRLQKVTVTGVPTKSWFNTYMSTNHNTGLMADLSSVTAATISSLRTAFQLQRLLERDARGGTRYTELLRSHFGVISPDARLQRPEFLGSSSTRINVNPVAQTSSSDSVTPQGNLAAMATYGDNFHAQRNSW